VPVSPSDRRRFLSGLAVGAGGGTYARDAIFFLTYGCSGRRSAKSVLGAHTDQARVEADGIALGRDEVGEDRHFVAT